MENVTPQGIRWTVDADAGSFPGGYRLLRAEAFIPLPRDEVFPFFAAAENLERITPPELRFRIVTPLPVEMREGTLIDYRLSLDGIPFGWRTRITEWDPPVAFTDTQLKGPYHTWIHRHTFEEADGGTLMRDEVRWRVPFWPLGAVAMPVVRAKVARIFRHRQETLGALLLT
ncbi:MAG TPA: SRPBCC family protein [Longimicrobiales bacterium]|nr:SRPBCC family protein [Longimicrobiales bacterium]